MTGMPSLVSSTIYFWMEYIARIYWAEVYGNASMHPRERFPTDAASFSRSTFPSESKCLKWICFIWAAFSSRVILERRSATLASTVAEGSLYNGDASCAETATPPAIRRRIAIVIFFMFILPATCVRRICRCRPEYSSGQAPQV